MYQKCMSHSTPPSFWVASSRSQGIGWITFISASADWSSEFTCSGCMCRSFMSSARLAKSMRWVRDACRNLTEYPECRMDKVAALSSLSRIVIWRPRSCPSKSSKGYPSENTAPAIEIISASVVERATDVWRREFHAIGQREASEERKIIMPDVDRAVCTHDARSASAYTCSSVSLSVPAW